MSFNRVGTNNYTYKDLAQEIELRTGGISASTHLTTAHSDVDTFEQVRFVTSFEKRHNFSSFFHGILLTL